MIMEDIELMRRLHERYRFAAPAVDLGGLETPNVADYAVSKRKAIELDAGGGRKVRIPHPDQNDRYKQIPRPWNFIDAQYLILNPEYGHPPIEELPNSFRDHFNLAIMVSVFEHVENPYVVSDAVFKLIRPGGYLFNSTPFQFPYHPSPEDNFRYSPKALERIHKSSGFEWLEGGFHGQYRSSDGVGDTNQERYLDPQSMSFTWALCRKPL